MLEDTDTSRKFNITPEGTYKGEVFGKVLKKPTKSGKGNYYEFHIAYIINGERKIHKEFLMPWTLPPLLTALGFKEDTKDHFSWDREACEHKPIKFTIKHEVDKTGKAQARMIEISADVDPDSIPF